MCWTDGPGRALRAAALAAAAAVLAGCAGPAGEYALMPLRGESLRANTALQADRAGTGRRLARDFAASAEPTVTFAFDSASLDAEARAALDEQARWLAARPGVRMTVTGHADLVGPERYNYGLGLRRAESARDYLVASGVPPATLAALESRGETDPLVPTAERERRNRRAVTAVAAGGSVRAGPGLDGTYAARIYDTYQGARTGVAEAEPITVN
jgi:outer membrane protein OmpA-like peptidoglycan-associated protein